MTLYQEIKPIWQTYAHLLANRIFAQTPKIDIPHIGVSRRGFWVDLFDTTLLAPDQLRALQTNLRLFCDQNPTIEMVAMGSRSLRAMYRSQGRYLRMETLPQEDLVLDCLRIDDRIEDCPEEIATDVSLYPEVALLGFEPIMRRDKSKTFAGVRIFGAAFKDKKTLQAFQKAAEAAPAIWNDLGSLNKELFWLNQETSELERRLRRLWEEAAAEADIPLKMVIGSQVEDYPRALGYCAIWGSLPLPAGDDPGEELSSLGWMRTEKKSDWIEENLTKIFSDIGLKDFFFYRDDKKIEIRVKDRYGWELTLSHFKRLPGGDMEGYFFTSFYRLAILLKK